MTIPKTKILVALIITAAIFPALLTVVMAQPGRLPIAAQRPTPNPSAVSQTEPSAEQPKEINMQNPLPDCEKYIDAGLYKEAFDALEKWTISPNADPMTVGQGLQKAVECLNNLNRVSEIDNYRDNVIATHAKNWRLLKAAADTFKNQPNNGVMIDGKFVRAGRSRGEYYNDAARTRVRMLQLYVEAMPLAVEDDNKKDVGKFFEDFAFAMQCGRWYRNAWQLQVLTDLSTLPDYEQGWPNVSDSYAPVDVEGNPIYYDVPESFEAAKNDGERWRWCLEMAVENDKSQLAEKLERLALFANDQFGTGTLADYNWFFREPQSDDALEKQGSILTLHTLKDNETITKLAGGIKRFELREDYDTIALYKQFAETSQQNKQTAYEQLAEIYANRRQFDTAAQYYQKLLTEFPLAEDWQKENWTNQRDQILGNWGRFESTQAASHGKGPNLTYVFRNGKAVTLTATEIKIPQLIEDIKAYIRSKPKQLDWNKISPEQIGYRLVMQDKEDNANKYLGVQKAKWNVPLKPADLHFDARTVITMPMTAGGAYLVKAEMADGNTDYIVVWINDTAIVQKKLDGKKSWFYVADAENGSPAADADVDVFSYRLEHQQDNQFKYYTKESKHKSDATGQLTLGSNALNERYQWLMTATTSDGRFAFSGFQNIWYADRHDADYNATKAFFISDRPVYRPGDTAEYKFWVGQAKYDQPYKSPFAGREVLLNINTPRGERFAQKIVKLDAYGGVGEKIELPADAVLGVWQFQVGKSGGKRDNGEYQFAQYYGGGSFRVEEYKKPEFEVTVDAPKEPVALGEKVSATISAKYYFGAPVTEANVKYKVLRTKHRADWYPIRPWDWFYGNGYAWFGYDYDWYPGWRSWGCARPFAVWYPRGHEQPEVVVEQEVAIGEDGTVTVSFDTAMFKEMFPNDDQKFEITAEVVDQSRRTIVGKGNVLVAKEPFKVYAWVNRGFYQTGQQIRADFQARRLDGKPVSGPATVKLLKVDYENDKPIESVVHTESITLNELGTGHLMLAAAQPGQYRVSCTVASENGQPQEGGYIFSVRGPSQSGATFRFSDLELVPNQSEYAPGDELELLVNTNRPGSTVMLFVRPTNGMYLPPQMLKITGQSQTVKIPVAQKDMPNFFVEAITVAGGQVFTETKELVVPPTKRILNVEVRPNSETYKPGEKAKVDLIVTDLDGKPVVGQNVVAIYDKSVEYISGGSNVGDIKEFFWKWRRNHRPNTASNLQRSSGSITPPDKPRMQDLGLFGRIVTNSTLTSGGYSSGGGYRGAGMSHGMAFGQPVMETMAMDAAVPMSAAAPMMARQKAGGADYDGLIDLISETIATDSWNTTDGQLVEATVRKDFADTAFWAGAIETDANGTAQVELDMPENLTTWKINVWAMAPGTQVGYATTDVITRKDLIIRMQTPRFLVQKDKILLTANVHNYLATDKNVQVSLEMDGDQLLAVDLDRHIQNVKIPANGEARVDWLVEAKTVGDATVRMKALTDEESDAMQMTFPVQVHGMLKQEAFSGVIRPNDAGGKLTVNVPEERIAEQSRLTVRFSPTLAGAMIDALPYLAEYPYGCTEQTLNRFLPAVITQKVLIDSGVDLAVLEKSHANLNAQELGDPAERAKRWQRFDRNPVYSADELRKMVDDGVKKLTEMQLSDGGWGWFSGYGEHSSAHITAQVVRGLRLAQQNDVAVDQNVIDRGEQWLRNYQAKQIELLKNAELPEEQRKNVNWKQYADNTDAFVLMVLTDKIKDNNQTIPISAPLSPQRNTVPLQRDNEVMGHYLYRDRTLLSLYGVAMLGIAMTSDEFMEQPPSPAEGVDPTTVVFPSANRSAQMCVRMLEQYLQQDDENQTAWLNLQKSPGWYWWCWYGSEFETQAMYLKLLMRVGSNAPQGDAANNETASRLVKYLLNNRKHATYWNSTRDTALCVEAFAEFLRATGEDRPNMMVEVLVDGKIVKTVEITPENMLTIDNTFVLEGVDVTAGTHEIEIRRRGTGPVYFNAYLENFTLEDFITAAGLEVKIDRRYWLLTPADKSQNVAGKGGQVVSQKVEKYDRTPIENLAQVKSGELVEIELIVESKNDYESLLIEDMKPAGFEPVEVRSGYNGNGLGAYVEYRDNRVTFFVYRLPRGTHNATYRMRAEQPGSFSALPAKIEAMYAPELKGNSDELKVNVVD